MEESGSTVPAYDFSGVFQHALDAKGRLTLPTAFRTYLAAGAADAAVPAKAALWLDRRCLVIYPKPVWFEFMAKLKALPWTDARSESVKRVVLASAYDCAIDRQGRLLVPPRLRELAELRRDITLVGKIDWMEIWDRTRWQEYFGEGYERLESNASGLL